MTKEAVLWGAGKTLNAFLSKHKDYRAQYIVDNDRSKFDTEFLGIPVRSPMFLRNEDRVVITSLYYFDIYQQLIAMEYPEEKLSVYFHKADSLLSGAELSSFIQEIKRRKSAVRDYVSHHMGSVREFPLSKQKEYLSYCLSCAPKEGLVAEFGVFDGASIEMIAALTRGRVFGFDSFRGLSSDWTPAYPKGSFDRKGELPQVPGNVTLVPGMFSETLDRFLAENPGPFSFIHIDCDLYESARDVLSRLKGRVVPGTVIAFDEYIFWESPGKQEFDAFQEFVSSNGLKYEYLAFGEEIKVAVRIL